MDPIPIHPEAEKWHKRAGAMNRVADLAHDYAYVSFLNEKALRERYHWESDDTKIALDRDSAKCKIIQYLGSDRILVIGDFAVEAIAARPGISISAELTVNDSQFKIRGLDDELFLETPNLGVAINISTQDLTEFMLNLAVYYVSNGHGSPLKMMNEYDQATDNLQRLIAVIYGLGNINGESSRTTWSAVKDDTNAFVARLTEIENPNSSELNHTIQTIDLTELFALESGFDITQTNDPEATSTPSSSYEVSYNGISSIDGTSQFIGAALRRPTIPQLPEFSYNHSADHGSEESRKYADDCIRFIELLGRLMPSQEQP